MTFCLSGLSDLQGPIHRESVIPLKGVLCCWGQGRGIVEGPLQGLGRPDPGWLVVQSRRTRERLSFVSVQLDGLRRGMLERKKRSL